MTDKPDCIMGPRKKIARSCGKCQWWDHVWNRDREDAKNGLCRISAPNKLDEGRRGLWPSTSRADWCAGFWGIDD